MGKFFSEIEVDRRLSAKLKRVNERRKRKGKRPHGKGTRVTVRDMEVLRFPLGRFYVRSSDLPRIPLEKGWSGDATRRLDSRLREGGEAKGRVLWGVWERLNEKMTVAALSYHWAGDGDIEITGFEATTQVTEKRALIEQIMIIAVERIACETSGGKKCRLKWEVPRSAATRIKTDHGFKEHAKSNVKSRVVLVRDADVASVVKARSVRG